MPKIFFGLRMASNVKSAVFTRKDRFLLENIQKKLWDLIIALNAICTHDKMGSQPWLAYDRHSDASLLF